MNKFLSDKANSVIPYVQGEQPKDKKYIKLNTNESPYPPSKNVKKAIIESDFDDLRLYPDPDISDLKNIIAEKYKLESENIFIGNGSDEILAFSFMAFFNKKDKIYYPNITYSFYSVYSDLFDLSEKKIPLKEDFSIDINNYKNLDSILKSLKDSTNPAGLSEEKQAYIDAAYVKMSKYTTTKDKSEALKACYDELVKDDATKTKIQNYLLSTKAKHKIDNKEVGAQLKFCPFLSWS